MANSVDPDQTTRSAASDLGLHCLHRPACPNTEGKYGIHKTHYLNILRHLHIIWVYTNCSVQPVLILKEYTVLTRTFSEHSVNAYLPTKELFFVYRIRLDAH